MKTIALFFAAAWCCAHAADSLTLAQAEAIAVKNHPQVAAALLNALAANQVTVEARAPYYPNLFASITAAGAPDNTRLAAGQINNPIIYNRLGSGFTVSQLITDFGRTSNLVAQSSFRAEAENDNAAATRAQVLLQVNQAYFAALRTKAVLTVADQTVAARQLVVDQVTALAASKLKSGLDVSFANVNLAEAKLLLASAQNEMEAAFADLSAALGYPDHHTFHLAEEPLPPALDPDANALTAEALRERPELAAYRAQQQAALKFVAAERALAYPSIGVVASAGAIPGHEDTLRGSYGALGLNVNIPIFNGHLFSARRAEADYRARAAEQNVKDLENRIARDVQVAWLNAGTAYQRLGLTAELLAQAGKALDLADARYHIGLGSIVELSQAQLAKTSAEIAATSARYDYQLQRAVLAYQAGEIK